MEILEESEPPKPLKWAKRVGFTLLFLDSSLCLMLGISILNGNRDTAAWWPLVTYGIDFPISLLFPKGGVDEFIGITFLGGAWHFFWPQWVVLLYLKIKN